MLMRMEPTLALNSAKLTEEFIRFSPLIGEALSYSGHTHTLDDIYLGVMQGRYRLWALEKSFMVTEISVYPQAKHYHLFLGGGDLEEIFGMQDAVKAAARECGCSLVTITGRSGWRRLLVKRGWKAALVTLSLEVGNE